MASFFKLNDDHTTSPLSFDEYFAWNKGEVIVVGKQKIGKDVKVSTVFLGLNHSYREDEEPLLFETMVFGGEHDQYMVRCSTWEGAVNWHKDTVEMCGGKTNKKIKNVKDDSINSRFDILDL